MKSLVRKCRACGCTEHNACYKPNLGPCHWVEENLCSQCTASTGADPVSVQPWNWQPIEEAPKSVANGTRVQGIYLLGFVPADHDELSQSGVRVIWWEPTQRCTSGPRRGMMGTWISDDSISVEPSHFMPLPPAPLTTFKNPAPLLSPAQRAD